MPGERVRPHRVGLSQETPLPRAPPLVPAHVLAFPELRTKGRHAAGPHTLSFRSSKLLEAHSAHPRKALLTFGQFIKGRDKDLESPAREETHGEAVPTPGAPLPRRLLCTDREAPLPQSGPDCVEASRLVTGSTKSWAPPPPPPWGPGVGAGQGPKFQPSHFSAGSLGNQPQLGRGPKITSLT